MKCPLRHLEINALSTGMELEQELGPSRVGSTRHFSIFIKITESCPTQSLNPRSSVLSPPTSVPGIKTHSTERHGHPGDWRATPRWDEGNGRQRRTSSVYVIAGRWMSALRVFVPIPLSGPSFHSLVQRTPGSMMKLNWGNFASRRRSRSRPPFAGPSADDSPGAAAIAAAAPAADDHDDDDDGCHCQSRPEPDPRTGVLLFLGWLKSSAAIFYEHSCIPTNITVYMYFWCYFIPGMEHFHCKRKRM